MKVVPETILRSWLSSVAARVLYDEAHHAAGNVGIGASTRKAARELHPTILAGNPKVLVH